MRKRNSTHLGWFCWWFKQPSYRQLFSRTRRYKLGAVASAMTSLQLLAPRQATLRSLLQHTVHFIVSPNTAALWHGKLHPPDILWQLPCWGTPVQDDNTKRRSSVQATGTCSGAVHWGTGTAVAACYQPVSYGLLAVGLLATGLLAISLLATYFLAINMLVIGLLAISLLAIGQLAISLLSTGLLAVGMLATCLLAISLSATGLLAVQMLTTGL